MKIDLPENTILILLEESPEFRVAALEMIKLAACIAPSGSLRARVVAIVRENTGNKIAAIKAVRQFVHDNACSAMVAASFPEVSLSPVKANCLGLADSKKLVETIL